jgi:hypothetical protein
MPDSNRFDSGHAILAVRAVNGDVHDVAIPDGTSLESVHAALSSDPIAGDDNFTESLAERLVWLRS